MGRPDTSKDLPLDCSESETDMVKYVRRERYEETYTPTHFLDNIWVQLLLRRERIYEWFFYSQLGAVKPTWTQAARAIGPNGQCGARATSYISVNEAILRSSLIPPQWATYEKGFSRNRSTINSWNKHQVALCQLPQIPDKVGSHAEWKAVRLAR